MSNIIEDFKEVLNKGMISNFEKDGHLVPIFFYIKGNQPFLTNIPNEFLSTPEGKHQLSNIIKNICVEPDVIAAGMVIEGYGAKMEKDNPLRELVIDKTIKVSELSDNVYIIMLIFSTPEGDEMISYVVDVENKIVGDKWTGDSEPNSIGGIFSGFFKWGMN